MSAAHQPTTYEQAACSSRSSVQDMVDRVLAGLDLRGPDAEIPAPSGEMPDAGPPVETLRECPEGKTDNSRAIHLWSLSLAG
jgi:hypothetical protein